MKEARDSGYYKDATRVLRFLVHFRQILEVQYM